MTGTDRSPGRLARCWECVLVFFVLPPCLYFVRHVLAFRVIPGIAALGLAVVVYLLRAPGFDCRTLCSPTGLPTHLRSILRFFVPAAALLALGTALLAPTQLLAFPRRAPGAWAAVMVLYPTLAVVPQELLFRVFFAWRYGALFKTRLRLIAWNGISFGLAHVFYGNWVAVALSIAGGMLFAHRYLRTRSLLAVSIEHGLWGDFLFTVGLGWYFYSGSIQ